MFYSKNVFLDNCFPLCQKNKFSGKLCGAIVGVAFPAAKNCCVLPNKILNMLLGFVSKVPKYRL